MTLRTILAAFLGLFLATGAFAQTVDFRGGGFFTMDTDCTADGWDVQGTIYLVQVRYRPANVGDNGNEDRLTVFFPQFPYAMAFTVDGKLGNRFKDTVSVSIGSSAFQSDPPTEARLIKRTPRSVRPNTQSVRLQTKFRNLDGLAGCEASLDTTIGRTPWVQ